MKAIEAVVRRELDDLKQSVSVWRIHSVDEFIGLIFICIGLLMLTMA